MTGQQNQFHNYSLISIHFAWGPNVYSKPESNLITSPSIKTRQETAQCLDFLYLNLKTNQMVYKGRTLYFLWTHFHAERVLHFAERTTKETITALSSVFTGLLGEEGQHLSWGAGSEAWLLGFLPSGGALPLCLPAGVKEAGLPYPAESTQGFLAITRGAV